MNDRSRTKKAPSIYFTDEERHLPLSSQEMSVLETVLRAESDLDHSCGGNGTCGTCCIVVQSNLSQLAPRNEIESEMAADRGFKPQERLACQLIAFDGLIFGKPKST